MYKMIIVDDEEIIRKGLCSIIDWEGIGFSVAGAFPNAEKALSFLELNEVDVVLTDIRMPRMSGIEFIEKIKTIRPEIKTIFISGYSDFSCAQKAVEFGAFRYILKPTREDEMQEIFADLKKVLDNEIKTKRHAFENRNYILGEIVSRFAANRQTDSDVEYFERLFERNGGCMAVMEIEIFPRYFEKAKNTDEKKQAVLRHIHETIESYDPAEIIRLPRTAKDRICMLVFTEADENTKKICNDLYLNVGKAVEEYAEFSFAASYGKSISDPQKVGSARNTAENLTDMTYLKSPCIFPDDKLRLGFPEEEIPVRSAVEEIISCLKHRNSERIEAFAYKFVKGIIGLPDNSRQNVCGRIFNMLKILYKDCVVDGLISEDSAALETNLLAEISKYKTVKDLTALLVKKVGDINIKMQEHEQISGKRFVKKTIQIINSQYAQNIKLSNLAYEMMITPEHLSRTIKKETGKNFRDFLIEVRLTRAKELLKDSELKVYEIAERTGFSNQHYFSTVFKTYSGMTPVQYRELA